MKQSSRGIKKDKFSAFEYGMYYIKLEEEKRRKHKASRITDFMFFT
nr:MAG TPA: terminase large subunit [Caudoviricetes sp.]